MATRIARFALAVILASTCCFARGEGPLRFGTTTVFLDDEAAFIAAWSKYLQRSIGRPVQFIHRGSYREITELMRDGKLDLAWVCSPPYLRNRDKMVLAVVPLFHGKPYYQSYLIVPASDKTTTGFADLKGKIYAFSDPDSNSGWLAPQAAMKHANLDATTLFKRTFFTWAHKKVVEAVAVGLAQGGSVDGYVWEALAVLHPDLTAQTRVAWKSPWYGFPPIVARSNMSAKELHKLQDALIDMRDDDEGRRLLHQLDLDGFAREDGSIFADVEKNLRFVFGY